MRCERSAFFCLEVIDLNANVSWLYRFAVAESENREL